MPIKTEQGTNIYIEAETSGAVPTSPRPQAYRYVSESIEGDYDTIESSTLIPGRNPAKSEKGTESSAGDLTVEFAVDEHDILLEALLCGTWTANTSLSDSSYTVHDLVPGVTQRTFYLLKEYTQAPVKYQLFRNLQINSLNMPLSVKSFVPLTFSFLGSNNAPLVDSAPVSLTNKGAAKTTDRFITTSGFLKYNSTERTKCSEASLVINNNMDVLYSLFQQNAIETALGMLDITGSITEYLDDGTLYNLAKDGATGSLEYNVIRENVEYTFIMNITFDNSGISKSGRISATLPFKTYGSDRLTIRRKKPTA
jgi:hypothetical protein